MFLSVLTELWDVKWGRRFPDAFVESLHHVYSDHHPLLLLCKGVCVSVGPRPFWFEVSWTMHHGFEQVVCSTWEGDDWHIWNKLNMVSKEAIIFNKEMFGNIFKKKRILEGRIKGVQEKLERGNSLSLALLERDLQKEYSDMLRQEELFWFQKSNEKWVKLGDRNTSFFHTHMIMRRKRNKVIGLFLSNGTWSNDENVLKKEALDFYQSLFCSTEDIDLSILSNAFFSPN